MGYYIRIVIKKIPGAFTLEVETANRLQCYITYCIKKYDEKSKSDQVIDILKMRYFLQIF